MNSDERWGLFCSNQSVFRDHFIMNETNFVASLVQLLVPQPCFDVFFTDYDFFNAQCLKVFISKGLGYAIILGSVLVKVPQILKVCKAKSGEGISFASVLFELIAISANASYSFSMGFPFSSYGEGVFLAIQTSLIMFLLIYFGGNLLGSFLFLGVYGGIMAYLLSPMVPIQLLEAVQGLNIVIIILSKLIQAWANYKNSSTGQLSAITVFLIFAGSLSRIFTSIQETGDELVVIMYICSSFFNGILASQIVYYSRRQKTE